MRGLIIGLGRAGRRHGATLNKLGIKWDYYDPHVPIGAFPKEPGHIYTKIEALKGSYDFAVICTPPDLHLFQIKTCLDAGLPVICEKPLCALGKLGEAEALLTHPLVHRVMMAQNYRFHPALVAIKRQQEKWESPTPDPRPLTPTNWACFSDQHRIGLPSWGLLLDHVSHSVDILLWLSDMKTLEVERATHTTNETMETWFLDGSMGSYSFNIWESIRKAQVNKIARVSGPFGNVEVTPAMDDMMGAMYRVFLAHLESNEGFPIGLKDGVSVQRVLEKAMEVANGGV